MENIVIYARYSSAGQTEQSIEGQIRVCKEFAQHNGYNVINEYIDRAITGTNDNRPSFQQMISDYRKKEFQYILVYKLDRFARNKYDSVFYKHILQQYDVGVLSATESISDTPEGRLVEGILEMMAEMYSQDLSQKVKRGMRESILKGHFLGGHIPYGYKLQDKKLVIDEEKAPAVKYFFEEYAKGRSKKEIIKDLNTMGYRLNNGNLLCLTSFSHSLTNKKYTGVFDNSNIINENYCPAIISKDLFNKVQSKLAEKHLAPAKSKAKQEYILSGKTFCGYCGSSIVGVSGTSKTQVKHGYYVCSKRYKEKNCKKKYEKKGFLEWHIVQTTVDLVLRPDNAKKNCNLNIYIQFILIAIFSIGLSILLHLCVTTIKKNINNKKES